MQSSAEWVEELLIPQLLGYSGKHHGQDSRHCICVWYGAVHVDLDVLGCQRNCGSPAEKLDVLISLTLCNVKLRRKTRYLRTQTNCAFLSRTVSPGGCQHHVACVDEVYLHHAGTIDAVRDRRTVLLQLVESTRIDTAYFKASKYRVKFFGAYKLVIGKLGDESRNRAIHVYSSEVAR